MSGFHYQCSHCGAIFERDEVRYLCPYCEKDWKTGEPLLGILLAQFDYEKLGGTFKKERPDWQCLCAVEKKFHPPLAVGCTPLVSAVRLGRRLDIEGLWIKNDGLNPSGSLKDRASFLMVAEALRLGEKTVVAASTGNAASALASQCAAAGLKALIFVPENAPRAKLLQIALAGAHLIRVRGNYDDAFRLSVEYTKKYGGLNRNTAYHPLTIEGKKTVALEIAEQFAFDPPDSVIIPVGDGVILSAVYKGFWDLLKINAIEKMPRMIAVQAKSSNAIHQLVESGTYRDAKNPSTLADSISVRTPSAAFLAAEAVKNSGGCSVQVRDEEILSAQKTLLECTGVFAEPAAAATVAGAVKLRMKEYNLGKKVVLLITGHGLKDIDAPLSTLSLPEAIEPDLNALKG